MISFGMKFELYSFFPTIEHTVYIPGLFEQTCPIYGSYLFKDLEGDNFDQNNKEAQFPEMTL